MVVRPSTRFLCVCGTISSSLKAVQAHTENCKLTKNLANVVKETKAVSKNLDKRKCFLKCKGMDPAKWKNQVDVFNNMMLIEYIQQAGWHLQCHPNSANPIVKSSKKPDGTEKNLDLWSKTQLCSMVMNEGSAWGTKQKTAVDAAVCNVDVLMDVELPGNYQHTSTVTRFRETYRSKDHPPLMVVLLA